MPRATQCHAVYMQLHHVTHLSNWRRREGLSQSSCLTRVGALSPSAQRSYGSARGLALLWHWDFYDLRWAMQVQLGNGGSSSWSTSSTWLPLFLEAQPLEEVLSRCRQGSTQVATSVCVGRLIYFCGIQHSSICKSWLIMINDEQQCVDECTNMCKPFADARNPISIPKIITSPHFATSIATLQLPGKPKLGIYNCRALLRAVLRRKALHCVVFSCPVSMLRFAYGAEKGLVGVSGTLPWEGLSHPSHFAKFYHMQGNMHRTCKRTFRTLYWICSKFIWIHSARPFEVFKKKLEMDTKHGAFFQVPDVLGRVVHIHDWHAFVGDDHDDLVCTGSLQTMPRVILHELHVPSFIEGQFRWNDTMWINTAWRQRTAYHSGPSNCFKAKMV